MEEELKTEATTQYYTQEEAEEEETQKGPALFIFSNWAEFNKHVKLREAEPRKYRILSEEPEPEHIKQITQNIKAM